MFFLIRCIVFSKVIRVLLIMQGNIEISIISGPFESEFITSTQFKRRVRSETEKEMPYVYLDDLEDAI